MFRPFRFAFWLRIAVLGLFTGEMTGGANFSGNFPSNFGNRTRGTHTTSQPFPWHPGWFTPVHILEIAIAFVAVMVVVTLVFSYINAIFRFILFDAVLHGNARIGEGWRKWRDIGRNYFVWLLVMALVGLGAMVVCFLPVLLLFTSHHLGMGHADAVAIGVIIVCFLAFFVLAIVLNIVMVVAKDFVVPIMALEGATWQEGWRKFREIARGHAGEYVVYFLMKILLRIGAGIAHGIVFLIPLFILMIPVGILVVAGIALGAGATAAVKALLITAGIILGIISVVLMIALSALLGAPIAFFFPSYSIYFFAGRYEALGRIVFPPLPPPPPPVIPEPPIVPEMPPAPA